MHWSMQAEWVLSEFGKIGEIEKMCHVMSIDEQVTCMGWFNVFTTEFIVFSARKDRVDLVLIYPHVAFFVARLIWVRKRS